jgi:carnitine 3-dehydrogenase
MTKSESTRIERVAVVGTGLVGSRWAAFFLGKGLEVVAYDSAAGFQERLHRDVESVWWAIERMGLSPGASISHLRFASDLREAVADADFVQENALDDAELKQRLIADIDAACPPETIIASSTSGIRPSLLQTQCSRPERVLVAHPINPVHILPLVEIVGGERTSADSIERAMAFYRGLGKRPLRERTEVPGFIVNRLLQSLYREMMHLVNDGIATTEEIDAAVTEGPGLRLALLGPAAVLCLVGGRGGITHTFRQFDPARMADWSHNYYPDMTAELLRRLEEQTNRELAGRSMDDWERLRDEFLLRVLQMRRELTEVQHIERAAARQAPGL